MHNPMTEPVRGEPDLVVDSSGKSWVFAPNGHRYPFDKIIRILLIKHMEGENKIVASWANQGTYTLRYDDDLAEQISSWDVGSRHRVKMWADRIEEVLPMRKKGADSAK